jgi:ketosteroid isomerase-like protein
MDVAEEIWNAIKESNRAWLEGNPRDVEPLFSEDVVMVAPKLAARIVGRQEMVQSYVEYVRAVRTHMFEEHEHFVDVNGETAVATYHFTVRYELDGRTFDDSGQEILVFARRDGRWRGIWRTQVTLESRELK